MFFSLWHTQASKKKPEKQRAESCFCWKGISLCFFVLIMSTKKKANVLFTRNITDSKTVKLRTKKKKRFFSVFQAERKTKKKKRTKNLTFSEILQLPLLKTNSPSIHSEILFQLPYLLNLLQMQYDCQVYKKRRKVEAEKHTRSKTTQMN